MGHHFVPQHLLRGFQSPERANWIWRFDKQTAAWKHLPISQVAQVPDFYESDIEVELNEKVEKPANAVIDKLRRGEAITDDDHMDMTYYLATVIRRVPGHRKKAESVIPIAISDAMKDVRERLRRAAAEARMSIAEMTAKLEQVDATEQKFLAEPPEQIRKIIETPWPFDSMLRLIRSMFWRVVQVTGEARFLICDNPAVFFDFGLGHQECELILPLSSTTLLHCCWQWTRDLYVKDERERLVKEFNRRIAARAERCVFCHKQVIWLAELARNAEGNLSRISWDLC